MLSVGYNPESIGVMCFYTAQKLSIQAMWMKIRQFFVEAQNANMNEKVLNRKRCYKIEDIDSIGITITVRFG